MAIISRFAGLVEAWSYAYGVNPGAPAALQVISGSQSAGTYTLVCRPGPDAGHDGVSTGPSTNTPVLVGLGANQETVTPSSVSTDQLGNILITATFANAHSSGDQVRSGTYGLQEAINYCNSVGGGSILISPQWRLGGGTNAIISAAVLPFAGNVDIQDVSTGGPNTAGNVPNSATQISAPTALTTAASTNGMITTATTGGSIPASGTYRLGVTYVDAFGGETLLSVDTASTATIAVGATSTNTITVTSPAAATGAVGYRVYMTAASGASLSEILYPVGNSAITGTAVAGAATPSFQIGTPVTITAIITGTATVPLNNSAFAFGTVSVPSGAPVVSYLPFAALSTIAAAATGTLASINLPTGFLNTLGRTIRFKGMYYVTTNGTAGTVTTQLTLASIFGVTSITPFTAASASIAASVLTINFEFDITMVTTATGATGTLECHGVVDYNIAGTAVGSVTMDSIHAASSTIDLTKQDTLSFSHLNTTVGTTASQLRLLTVEVLQ